jgi:hypothetical protein
MHGLDPEILRQLVALSHHIVILESGVVFDRLISAVGVEAELWRRRVVEIVDMCEDIIALGATQLWRIPHHLHFFVIHAPHLVLVVDPSEKERLKPHLTE